MVKCFVPMVTSKVVLMGLLKNFLLMTPVEIKKAVFIMPERKNKNANSFVIFTQGH